MPLVQAARRGDPSALSVAATEQGKRRVDALRLQFDRFTQAERDLIDSRQNGADADSNRVVVVAVGGLACSLLLVLMFGAYLTRQVAAPVRRAAALAGRLARGDLSARTPVGGPAEGGAARLEVRDDGVGGANVRRGSGLVGLGDRLAAVGGSFEVLSPRDGGTVLRAEIPIGEVPAAPAVHGDRPGAAAD